MNKFLLDTHILLWLYFNSDKLSKNVNSLFKQSGNVFYVSTVSIWEISIKFHLGKLDLGNLNPLDLRNLILENNIKIINLESETAATLFQLTSIYHRDPFDRILIWQAIQNNYTFITDDKNIKLYKSDGLKTIW
jgi:PIN domain nuclease of toxin-antitoxin system